MFATLELIPYQCNAHLSACNVDLNHTMFPAAWHVSPTLNHGGGGGGGGGGKWKDNALAST